MGKPRTTSQNQSGSANRTGPGHYAGTTANPNPQPGAAGSMRINVQRVMAKPIRGKLPKPSKP